MINERFELPVKAGLTLLWAGFVMGAYYFSESVSEPLVARFYIFMLLDPLLLCLCSFLTAKVFGSRWYYKAAVIAVSAVLFFATPMRDVVPNLIIVTAVCVIFGGGLGGVFSAHSGDEEAAPKPEHYTPILGEESHTPNKKKRKKKAKRK
ncbi:MAG: hypothetical protein IKR76_02400 [Ruminococcus sp.]|nr:hypothetical protein [Ruminococcus sp.]